MTKTRFRYMYNGYVVDESTREYRYAVVNTDTMTSKKSSASLNTCTSFVSSKISGLKKNIAFAEKATGKDLQTLLDIFGSVENAVNSYTKDLEYIEKYWIVVPVEKTI